ncbi:MAG: hypothetical protein Q9195_001179 [Heterodermia aff. obscurata]
MSSRRSATINHSNNYTSASPSADVYSTAMGLLSSNMRTSTGASSSGAGRARRHINLSADASSRYSPYGNAQPGSVGGHDRRGGRSQLAQSPLPAGAYDLSQLSRQTNAFDLNFQEREHQTSRRAPTGFHNGPDSSQPTPLLQQPNLWTSQQLEDQDDLLWRDQQAASLGSENYVEYRGSSQPMGYTGVSDIHMTPELAPEDVHVGHHYGDAGTGNHLQHVDHSVPMGETMMHGVSDQGNRLAPSYMNEKNFHLDPSFFQNGPDTDRSYLDTPSPYMQSAGTQPHHGSVPAQSRTVNRGIISQPHREKAPAQVENKPNSTEAICHINGQLYHRSHPQEKWGKFLIDLMDDDSADDGPVPAVYHSAIFDDLLRWAKGISTYNLPQAKGKTGGDETAPVKGHETWGPARGDRPGILFQIEKPEHVVQVCERFQWTWHDLRVLDRNNGWMWYWDDVPVTISSVIEGWHLEVLLRRNPLVEMSDIQARMLDNTPFVERNTALTNRTMRFRARSWNHTWGTPKPSSTLHLNWLKVVLPEECIQANSTRGVSRDLTREEEKELEAFPKKTPAEQNAILDHRRRVRGLLLRPQTTVASSSLRPLAPAASATNPIQVKGDANPRKRQRRDSIEISTSEDFNEAVVKRRRLQTGSSEMPDDEQVRSNGIQPAPEGRQRYNDLTPQCNQRNQGSGNMELRRGPVSTVDWTHPGGGRHQWVDQNAANQGMLGNTQHHGSAALSTAHPPTVGHPQPRFTYDDYHLDPKLDSGDNAEDAPSKWWGSGDAAFDQPQEPINLGAGQPQARADNIEYINDIRSAPAGFWDPVDLAAHQLQVEHDSLTDGQRRILKTLASQQLEVGKSYMIICLDDREARQAPIDANSDIVFDRLSIEKTIHEIANLAVEPYHNAVSQNDRGKQPETNVESQHRLAYLPVDKTFIVLCVEEYEAYQGITAAGGETIWNKKTLQAVVDTLVTVLTWNPVQSSAFSPTGRPMGNSDSIPDNDQALEDIRTETHVREDPGESMIGRNGIHAGRTQELGSLVEIQPINEHSLELPSSGVSRQKSTRAPPPPPQRVSPGNSKFTHTGSPAIDAAFAGNIRTSAASSTASSSTLFPNDNMIQPTEKEQEIANNTEASFATIWDDWAGDGHYLASVQHRADIARRYPFDIEPPVIKPAVEGSSGDYITLASKIQTWFTQQSFTKKRPDYEEPVYNYVHKSWGHKR